MVLTTGAPVPDAAERAHLRLCGIVTLETIVCFAIPAIALLAGTVYSPIVLLAPVANPTEFWAWRPAVLLVFGWAGCVGVGRLLTLLWNRPQSDSRRWLTLAAVACGCGASLLQEATVWMGKAPDGLEVPIVYLPLACTLHLVFLNRRALFG